jgi:rhodanese-related sulfurtransferase
VVVRTPDQDVDEVVWQAHKIGYDRIVGELEGGIDTWTAAGRQAAVIPLVDAASLSGAQVLDIRQDNEYAAGHVPGALHLELGSLMSHLSELPSGPMVVMCGHGERAMGAASLLQRAGRADLAVLGGGPDDWARATGRPLEPR